MKASELLGTVGSVAGLADSVFGISSSRQMANQEELMNIQAEKNNEAMDYSQKLQKEMYEYTGYGSKVRQMEAAGLNPALMYGNASGMGGTTGSSSPIGISGASAPNEAAFQANRISMALNTAKLESEIEVNKSIAAKNTADANLTGGAQTTKVAQEATNLKGALDLMVQQTSNEKIKGEGIALQNDWQKIDNLVKAATNDAEITRISNLAEESGYNVKNAINEYRASNVDATIKEKTIGTVITQYNANLKKTIMDIVATKTGAINTQAQTDAIATKLEQGWKQLEIEAKGKQIDYERVKAMIYSATVSSNATIDAATINAVSKIGLSLITQ